jgi:hypothetical protein
MSCNHTTVSGQLAMMRVKKQKLRTIVELSICHNLIDVGLRNAALRISDVRYDTVKGGPLSLLIENVVACRDRLYSFDPLKALDIGRWQTPMASSIEN